MHRSAALAKPSAHQSASLQPVRIALPWYEAEDWPILHSLFVERDSVSEDHDTWLVRALEAERRATVDGYDVVRVIVRPEALLDWCQSNNRILDLKARHDYAQELMRGGRHGEATVSQAATCHHA